MQLLVREGIEVFHNAGRKRSQQRQELVADARPQKARIPIRRIFYER